MNKLWLLLPLLLLGCAGPVARQSEFIRQGVYAVGDSIDKKRFDLASKYSEELKRVVPPPDKRIEISEFSIQTGVEKKVYSVLPSGSRIEDVIIENSEEYRAVVSKNKSLSDLIIHESIAFDKYRRSADARLADMSAALSTEKRKSFWSFLFGALPFAGIGTLIAVCIFFPPALPLVTNWFSSFIAAISKLLSPKI